MLKPEYPCQLSLGHLFSKDLLGCWMFNERGENPTAYDISGRDNHGTLVGNVGAYDCKFGVGLDFPGNTGDYVSTSINYQTLGETKGSISVWVNADDTTASDRIWDMKGSTVWSLLYFSNKFNFYKGGSGGVDISSAATVVIGRWYHVVCTWDMDNNTAALYVDGILENSTASFTTSNDGGALWFGSENDNTNQMNGKIDHVMAWKREFTSQEVESLYADSLQMIWRPRNQILMSTAAAPLEIYVYDTEAA